MMSSSLKIKKVMMMMMTTMMTVMKVKKCMLMVFHLSALCDVSQQEAKVIWQQATWNLRCHLGNEWENLLSRRNFYQPTLVSP